MPSTNSQTAEEENNDSIFSVQDRVRESRVRFGSDQAYSQPIYSALQGESVEEEEESEERGVGWNGQGESTTLAINASRGKVGCCYYAGREVVIYLMEDTEDAAWDLVKTRKLNVESTFTLLNTDRMILFIRRSSRADTTEPGIDFSFSGSPLPRHAIDEFITFAFPLLRRFDDLFRRPRTCQARVSTTTRLLRGSGKERAG